MAIEMMDPDTTIETAEHEALSQLYADTMKEIAEGSVLKGRILSKTATELVVDIGYKSEGIIALSEFPDPAALQVGDEIDVYLETKENDEGMVVLSKRKADRVQGWERVIAEHKEGDIIEGRCTRKVKGGYMVDVGIEAFLPASLSSLKGYAKDAQLLGHTLKFIIVKIGRARKNIVLSHKDYLYKEKELTRSQVLETLVVGQRRTGLVKNLTDFGAFIDLGGVDGLLHIADMSWSRIAHPSEVLQIGQQAEVLVLAVDKTTHKISLGLKQLQPSPWEQVNAKYPTGTRVTGKVVNIVPYGAFVEVEKGVEGLVHISEMSWTKRIAHPSDVLAVGQQIEAVVLSVDAAHQKLSLGVRQTEANPWTLVAQKYAPGTRVTGKVRMLSDYGAFVELEEGIEGLLHNADLSWTRKINHPSEILKKGKTVDAVVLSCDPENRRIALSIKQLISDPWPDIQTHYGVGTVVDGQVTKIANFGLFVELSQDVEGLVHISEIVLPSGVTLETHFTIGQPVKVRVIRIDDAERKIALSLKAVD